ncbi:MAG: hypothetical protein QGH15_08115 [Kiritimatiellia bacterium]|nr:hypothetical protein [Kiritimatiellia bacterium]
MGSRNRASTTVMQYTAFLFVATLILFCVGLYGVESASDEAWIREAIRRQIAANSTEGRQALVSSAWWGPLPSLLGLPFSLLFTSPVLPVSSLLVSALMGSASLLLLYRVLQKWGAGKVWPVFVGAMALNPVFLKQCVNGSSATTSLFFTVLVAYGLTEWIHSRSLRYLVYFGFASGMLIVSDFNMAMWVLVAFALVGVDLVARKFEPGQRQAVLIMALTPLVYVSVLWLLMNWLVMGDGFYFLRSLGGGGIVNPPDSPTGMVMSHKVTAIVCSAVAVICVLARSRSGFYLGLLGAAPLALAYYLNSKGFFWDPVPLLFCILPLCILLLGRISGKSTGWLAKPAAALALIPAVITAWMYLLCGGLVADDNGDQAAVPGVSVDRDLSRQIAQHVMTKSELSKIYVCGYDGFLLTEATQDSLFINALDFNFYKAKDDYGGHALYLLIHRPDGRSAMESIHWKFEGIHNFGDRGTLHDGDFGAWRLYEIIQPAS